MVNWKEKLQKIMIEGRDEIDKKASDKLMEEEMNPTLRQSKDEPLKAVDPKEKS